MVKGYKTKKKAEMDNVCLGRIFTEVKYSL